MFTWNHVASINKVFIILAAQEGHEVFGQAAAEDPEEEGGVRWRQSQEEGKQLLCSVKVRLCVRAELGDLFKNTVR